MKESAVKARIIDVASRLFYEQGYNLTGINQIIDEADIARASLYNHFASKTDLLLEYLREADAVWFSGLEEFLSLIKDPRKKLLAIFDYRKQRQLKSNFSGCHFIKISSEVARDETKVFELVALQKDRFKQYLKNLIQQLDLKQNLLTEDMLTETLFLLMEGAVVSANIYKSADAIKQAKQIADKLL